MAVSEEPKKDAARQLQRLAEAAVSQTPEPPRKAPFWGVLGCVIQEPSYLVGFIIVMALLWSSSLSRMLGDQGSVKSSKPDAVEFWLQLLLVLVQILAAGSELGFR